MSGLGFRVWGLGFGVVSEAARPTSWRPHRTLCPPKPKSQNPKPEHTPALYVPSTPSVVACLRHLGFKARLRRAFLDMGSVVQIHEVGWALQRLDERLMSPSHCCAPAKEASNNTPRQPRRSLLPPKPEELSISDQVRALWQAVRHLESSRSPSRSRSRSRRSRRSRPSLS